MASLKIIRRRIRTVKSIGQITKAMKMVAAVKLRKAQEKILAARPYAFKVMEMLQDISLRVARDSHPLLKKNQTQNKICLVVVTADKGLCGSFNSNIIRKTNNYLNENSQKDISLVLVGRKCVEFYKKYKKAHYKILNEFSGIFFKLKDDDAIKIAQTIIDIYINLSFDEVTVIYNEFKSAVSQKLTIEKLLPIEKIIDNSNTENKNYSDYIYEPDQEAILNALLPMYINTEVYRILLESSAAEAGAKMTAMDSATKNAVDMINKLTLMFNRARQSKITNEISEIISGANALK